MVWVKVSDKFSFHTVSPYIYNSDEYLVEQNIMPTINVPHEEKLCKCTGENEQEEEFG